jgi:hypothetical protein
VVEDGQEVRGAGCEELHCTVLRGERGTEGRKGQWRRQRVQEMEEKEGGPDPRATVAGSDLLPTGVGGRRGQLSEQGW